MTGGLRRRGSSDGRRVKHGDAWEAGEVGDVEGQEVGEAVAAQGGHVAGVVGRFAATAVGDDEGSPFGEQRGWVGEQGQEGLDSSQRLIAFGDRQAQAVIRNRAGGDDPELIERLRDGARASPCDRRADKAATAVEC